MTQWDPQIDLARLLKALAQEILSTSDDDVRRASVEGERAIRVSADEVRRVIDAILGDGVDAGDLDASLARAAGLREQRLRQH